MEMHLWELMARVLLVTSLTSYIRHSYGIAYELCVRSFVGACYNGPGPVWFTEFTGNTMVRSDGIALLDQQHFGSGGVNQNNCPVYTGPYVRWSVIRRNKLSGISRAQQPQRRCASITNSNPNSTDVLSEHNVIDCPKGGVTVNANGASLPWTDVNCSHCVTRT